MLRGELSNAALPVCCVDYRILLDVKETYSRFNYLLPRIMLEANLETWLRRILPLRFGAEEWIDRNRVAKVSVISVGVMLLAPAIDMILGEYVSDLYHFETREDLRGWLLVNSQVYKLLTNDPALLGLDEVTQRFGGWSEKA